MPLIATDTKRLSNVVKQELWPDAAYCRAVVTANEATAKSYVPGTLLGKVTAGGKYKISLQAAVDGSQNADAIVMESYTIPATTDVKVLVLIKGPAVIGKGGVIFDATYTTQPQKDAAFALLEAKGIQCNDSI